MNKTWNRRDVLGTAVAGLGATAALPLWAAETGPILIGQSLPLTGPVAGALQPLTLGQNMAIEQLNRKGGINGRPVKLIQLDDGYDPRRTVENVNTLIDKHNVMALTGLASTPGVAAVLPIIQEKKVPLFGVYTGSHLLRLRHNPYFYTTVASYKDEIVQCVRHLTTLKRGQISVVYQNNEFGKLMLPVAEQAIKELGGTLVSTTSLALDASDALTAAMAVNARQPQAVLMIAIAGPSVVGYVKAHKAVGAAPIYTISTAMGALPALGEEARGMAITQTVPYWRQTDALAREYIQEINRNKATPSYASYGAYLLFRMLFEGIRRAGKTITPQTVNHGLESIRKFNLGGGDISFSPSNHHPGSQAEITIVGPRGTFIR
jgi:branched-chain amino acid transport system substrate-binding protein